MDNELLSNVGDYSLGSLNIEVVVSQIIGEIDCALFHVFPFIE